MNVVNTIDILPQKQRKQLSLHSPNISHIDVKQVTSNIEDNDHSSMDSDNDSTDDTELFQTLSQIHGIVNPTLSSFDPMKQLEVLSSADVNEEKSRTLTADLNERNEMELSNGNEQVRRPIIFSSPFVINTIKQSDDDDDEDDNEDEEREEQVGEKNIIFHQNHNDAVDANDKQKEKSERTEEEEEEEKEKEKLEATSTTFFTNDSHSPIVLPDFDASYSLPQSFLLPLNRPTRSIEVTNQLDNNHRQISSISKINMTHQSDDQQTTTNLFDPFAPTTTSTTTMNTEEYPPIQSHSTQALANYNFDDLWNQSMSDLDSTNTHQLIDPNTFTWDALVENSTTGKTSLPTWESLFAGGGGDEEEETSDLKEYLNWILGHFNDLEKDIAFTSTQNLESIVKDIQMSTLPFEPIPSPPLHVDHTVSNPLINAIHHDLFPIDELEQPNINQGQQSMILYEEDEEEEEGQQQQNQPRRSFDDEVKPIVEKLVSDALQSAVTELNQPYDEVEHFVDQILTEAIYEIYQESQDEVHTPVSTENLASIISWHDQNQATKQQLPDPFDQKFDSVWSSHFQAPDDLTQENLFENESKTTTDPWLTNPLNSNADPLATFSQTFDESDLFSSSSNNPIPKSEENENDQSTVLSEYLPLPILTNHSSNTTAAMNNLMKYTLTAPVMDDSGDDSSPIEDYFLSQKVRLEVFVWNISNKY